MKRNLNKRLIIWAAIVSGILMIPLIAQFPWTLGDYVFATTVLSILALTYEAVTKNMTKFSHKLIAGVILLGVIIFIIGWAATGPDSEGLVNQGR